MFRPIPRHYHRPLPSCPHLSHPFSTSPNPPSTHYETLSIPPTSPPSAIKKAFYTLSKTSHPDLHPTDPSAPARFHRISEAYATLSIPAKRAAYDRTINLSRPSPSFSSSSSSSSRHPGSYASTTPRGTPTGPAGGRPPSGLSKRRSPFTGPPPSFYRSGGWGAHTEKRRAAHEASTSAPDPESPARYAYTGSTAWNLGGWSYGHNGGSPINGSGNEKEYPQTAFYPWPNSNGSRLAHFDSIGHLRTHFRQEALRNHRRSINRKGKEDIDKVSTGSKGVSIVVLSCLGMSFAMILAMMGKRDRREEKRFRAY